MTQSLLETYRRLLGEGKIAPDSAQALAVEKLQILTNRLAHYTPPARTDYFSFFTRRRGEVPKGLYIFGAVGRGKTMLMDLFFHAAAVKHKHRAHFHEFMADVHARLAIARREAKEDPILAVAKSIAAEARLLCLDELFVIDIADATILNRLFATLF
ncbi:MAG: cell division protein ZapE, partial [Rhodomicrobium sp.]|nr:cell division protein ZapE [Rhodomicrobium sp.]